MPKVRSRSWNAIEGTQQMNENGPSSQRPTAYAERVTNQERPRTLVGVGPPVVESQVPTPGSVIWGSLSSLHVLICQMERTALSSEGWGRDDVIMTVESRAESMASVKVAAAFL